MRYEYCEKNGIMITYTDTDVAFEERDTAMSILISNDGSILHNNFLEDKDKTQRFLDDFHRIYPTVCFFRSPKGVEIMCRAFEETRNQAKEQTLLDSIRALMDNLKMTAKQAMEALNIPLAEQDKYTSKL